MALIKTRPHVRLLLQRPLVAGELAEFIVQIDCPEPLPVDAIHLNMTGEVVWFTSGQYGRHRHISRFMTLEVPLLGEQTELDAGVHELRTRVNISAELPGTWRGDRLAIEYGVRVHVDIPWWPDKRVTFVVPIAGARVPDPVQERPTVYVSHAGGPPAKGGPYLEVSLERRSLPPGSTMRLSAALGNVEGNRYRKLHVSMIAQESFPTGLGNGRYTNEHCVNRWTVGIDDHPGELQPIPFALNLPRSLAPAFALHQCQLDWLLEIEADVAWGPDPSLRVPFEICPPEASSTGDRVPLPLAVGSDRLRLIWSKASSATGFQLVDDRLCEVVEGVQLALHRGQVETRTRVLGLLEFPDLAVDLHLEHERRGLLGASEAALTTRDAGQTQIIQARLAPLLEASKLELLEASDTRLEFGSASSGLEFEPLVAFAATLRALAAIVASLPDQLPPPAAMSSHVPAWTRASKRLNATLRPSDLSLSMIRENLQVSVFTTFDKDGGVRDTTFELDPGLAIPTRLHLVWSSEDPLPAHELELDSLVGIPAGRSDVDAETSVALCIAAGSVRVVLPAPLPDPTLEADRIEALFGLGRRLHGEQGPYR